MMNSELSLNIYRIVFKSSFIDILWNNDLLPVKKIVFSTVENNYNPPVTNPKVLLLAEDIKNYLAGNKVTFTCDSLDFSGLSSFSLMVLNELFNVEYGHVVTYKELSRRCRTAAVRAVGSVMAKNQFPIVYPCHRIIRSNGEIGEFAGGTELKRFLLELEGAEFISGNRVLLKKLK